MPPQAKTFPERNTAPMFINTPLPHAEQQAPRALAVTSIASSKSCPSHLNPIRHIAESAV
jgi:hypothetical protein